MGSAEKTSVRFYFDVISPYSWFAFETLCRYESLWDLEVHLIPVYLPGIMKAAGSTPPAAVKQRGRFLRKDLQRNQSFFGVDFNGMPANFMAKENTLTSMKAQRLLTAASHKYGETSLEWKCLAHELFMTLQSKLSNTEVTITKRLMLDCCMHAEIPAVEAEKLIEMTEGEVIKGKLKENTGEAISDGAFGVPTMAFDTPRLKDGMCTFFGSDRFEQIAFLLGKVWMDPNPSKL